MKKTNMPLYSKCGFVSAAITLLLYTVLVSMKAKHLYLYIWGFSSDEFIPVILLIAVMLFVSGCAVWVYKLAKHKTAPVLFTVVILFFVIGVFSINTSFSSDYKYYEFRSNDMLYHIVVKEQSYLLAGYGDIYEVTAPGIMTLVGDYTTDDGYRPFSDSKYYFEWSDDSFILYYYYGSDSYTDNNGYKSVAVSYAK